MSLVPYVIEQTSRGERSYDIYSRLKERIIFPGRRVNLHKHYCGSASVSGGGGYLAKDLYQQPRHAGFAIYDTMKYIKCDVLRSASAYTAGCIPSLPEEQRASALLLRLRDHDPSASRREARRDRDRVAENILKTEKKLDEILAAEYRQIH